MSKLDKFHRHEALDRTYLLLDNIDSHLLNHPYIADNLEYLQIATDAFNSLHRLYQLIGTYNEKMDNDI
jgi:hypothetical protein